MKEEYQGEWIQTEYWKKERKKEREESIVFIENVVQAIVQYLPDYQSSVENLKKHNYGQRRCENKNKVTAANDYDYPFA